MKKNLSLIALIAATLIVSSCASNKAVETKIDQEIKAKKQKENSSLTQDALPIAPPLLPPAPPKLKTKSLQLAPYLGCNPSGISKAEILIKAKVP